MLLCGWTVWYPSGSVTWMQVRTSALQAALAGEAIDGWLFYDFRGSDLIGRRILGLGDRMATRRWFYLVPARGEFFGREDFRTGEDGLGRQRGGKQEQAEPDPFNSHDSTPAALT